MSDTPDYTLGANEQDDATPKSAVVRGVCQECGAEVGGMRTWCDEHRPTSKPRRRRKRSAPRSADTPRVRREPEIQRASLIPDLTDAFEMMADVWEIRDPHCAGVLRQSAPKLAQRWDAQAQKSERLYNFLSDLGGGWIGLASAHVPLIRAMWVHHAVPAVQRRRLATMSPEEREAAEAQMQGNDAAMMAEAMRAYDAMSQEEREQLMQELQGMFPGGPAA